MTDVPMPMKPIPEIDRADLKAVRRFLTSVRDEAPGARVPGAAATARGAVPLRHGIARARTRPNPGPSA